MNVGTLQKDFVQDFCTLAVARTLHNSSEGEWTGARGKLRGEGWEERKRPRPRRRLRRAVLPVPTSGCWAQGCWHGRFDELEEELLARGFDASALHLQPRVRDLRLQVLA